MKKAHLGLGLAGLAAVIVFHAWYPSYTFAKLFSEIEGSQPNSGSFPVTAEVLEMVEAAYNPETLDAARWANCDPASLYPAKNPNGCGTVVIGSDDDQN